MVTFAGIITGAASYNPPQQDCIHLASVVSFQAAGGLPGGGSRRKANQALLAF